MNQIHISVGAAECLLDKVEHAGAYGLRVVLWIAMLPQAGSGTAGES